MEEKREKTKEAEKREKKEEREKIKGVIELYELYYSGLLKIAGSYAKVVNLRERKDEYIADVIIGNDFEGWMERRYNCRYPKKEIKEMLEQLEGKKQKN